jgi:hypothetical protein
MPPAKLLLFPLCGFIERLLAASRVARDQHDAHRALLIADDGCRERDGQEPAVARPDLRVVVAQRPFLDDPLERESGNALLVDQHQANRLTGKLGGPVVEQPAGRSIHAADGAAQIRDHHEVDHRLEHLVHLLPRAPRLTQPPVEGA